MATSKVKGTSKKIKELKGIKPEKISKEHLEKVQKSVNALNRAQMDLGSMEVKKHELMHSVAALRESLISLQDEFQKEYGTYDVDIQTGAINYPEENGKADKKN